ncbi:hypothetical protein [Streptomyces acidiscabies]|uniref:hypothetical protein n=1 Tax=Streptomyces acidiscabies TaxID=42234 RepID=UPI0038F7E7D6
MALVSRPRCFWCGLLGVLWFRPVRAQDDPKYRPSLLGATLTLGGAGVAATVKVFTRLEQTVMLAVDAKPHDETHHQLAVDALRTVRAACQGHIDAVA